ncbi:MAG: hypothetical protein AB8B69_16295 [Chitinophagales bacterium]
MKTLNALALINDIREEINEKGFQPDFVVQQLKELRGYALEEQNPVVTKALRLAYEHIALHQEFAIEYANDEDIEDEENEGEEAEPVEQIEVEEVDNFHYFIELIRNAENRFNRAELLDIIKVMMEFE